MARIRAKKKKNGIYYYLVESRRSGPNNSPREHILEYIGTVENLIEFATKQYSIATADRDLPKDLSFKCYEHGAEIAMFNTAKLLGIETIFDQCFKPRKLKGLSRGRILLLVIIHRIIDPGSKRAFAEWAKSTSLPYHLQFRPEDITSQTIWEAMDGITEKQIQKAQEMLARWNVLARYLIVKFNDMIIHPEENGQFTRDKYGLGSRPKRPGYPEKFKRALIKQTGSKFEYPTE